MASAEAPKRSQSNMEICEGQDRGLWLVLEDKKPVVAFPSKEQCERYLPIHVKSREDMPIMEIVQISFLDWADTHLHIPYPGGVRPPGLSTIKPWLPPKLGPGIPVSGPEEPLDIAKFREALEAMKRYEAPPPPFGEVYGPAKWGKSFAEAPWTAQYFKNGDGLEVAFGEAKAGTS